jgi:LacI family transcriptional regulator
MKQLLSLPQPPTAVFAISDKTALGALQAIKEAGLKAPDDISVVGFDDVADTNPPLTTLHVPKYQMGLLAMEQLLKQVGNEVEMPVRFEVYTNLIVRNSTAPP